MRIVLFIFFSLSVTLLLAQKKPLDHSVYDGWQSIGERKLSNDGKWVAYIVDVQEGDGELVVQATDNSFKRVYPRGYNITISNDSRFAIFRIKPHYADTRQARIKKKKPEDMPKDSLAIVMLGTDSVYKTARVKSYKVPEKGDSWVAYHLEKPIVDTSKKFDKMDSIMKQMDTSRKSIPPAMEEPPVKKKKKKRSDTNEEDESSINDVSDAEGDDPATGSAAEGTELVLRNLVSGEQKSMPFVSEYIWSKKGNILLVEGTASKADKKSRNTVYVWRTIENQADTISRGGNDFRNYEIDENGYQVAFVAERDSSAKALQKFYKLWHWQNGKDSAVMIVDKNSVGMPLSWTVSENETPSFSKNGKRLFFGTAPVKPAKDTTLVEIDLVKVDVWHYNDDYLQPQQLRNLDRELKRSYLAVFHTDLKKMVQLADRQLPQVLISDEGNGDQFAGITDMGKRVQAQWEGRTLKDIYAVSVSDGSRKLVKKDLNGNAQVSPKGKYIFWYDETAKHYFSWANGKTQNISGKVKTRLYDERFDMPDDPNPYGIVRWTENDESLLVYDRYDIWQLDPGCCKEPVNLTAGEGRKTKTVYRYQSTDPEERFLKPGQDMLLRTFRESDKKAGISKYTLGVAGAPKQMQSGNYSIGNVIRARDANVIIYTKESFTRSPNMHVFNDNRDELQLSRINPQQDQYIWCTAELFKWKAYDGKDATGILYKPENFDPKRKYPLIVYFYERLSDGLYTYLPPAPTPSRLNIPFFVSRGYLVLAPDIIYTKGYPGKAGFDYVVSGARAVAKKGWADSTRMGIQGQSWGGYQAAHIITRTKLFKAAWAGAPVVNMTSAYGGIRWESGLNRQFQYEHSQSRIGASLWEKRNLYIENSPLFHLQGVTTPLVIMANDADGAVPWYQGIEIFTAMRRLQKKVWMLNYNGEAHNLVERRNRKDIQIREQQFFDWLLKGEKPPRWITDGVPAVDKGKDWGLD